MLGSPILYLKSMRTVIVQLSGFYCRGLGGWLGAVDRASGLAVVDLELRAYGFSFSTRFASNYVLLGEHILLLLVLLGGHSIACSSTFEAWDPKFYPLFGS